MPSPIAVSTVAAQAFRMLELAPISSFDDDSEQAASAAEQYPVALETCLEAADWSFASTWARLPQVVLPPDTPTDPGLPFLFALPGDVLRLRQVGDAATRWRRDREGLRASHAGPLAVRYTARLTVEALMPAGFRNAVALRLAVLLSARWLTTHSKRDMLATDADRALKMAMRSDARQASDARWDGLPDQGDWVAEARA
ncbi:MAG TPA: hypothetical protein PKD10_05175 [Paracoccaceae bacterium]|nr:hypothetical protein [Paracoccaceae bacterium]HMO70084.1 hypothetical protein [Paracoccaceae bacterium]